MGLCELIPTNYEYVYIYIHIFVWISPLVCFTQSPSSNAMLSTDHDSIDELIFGRVVRKFSTHKPSNGWTPYVLLLRLKVMENVNHDGEKAMPVEVIGNYNWSR